MAWVEDVRTLYLDLMKKCLTNWIYGENETVEVLPGSFWKRKAVRLLNVDGLQVVSPRPMNPKLRTIGRDHEDGKGLPQAHTMIGLKRLDNIQFCIENVLANNIPGNFIEAGVWQGGAALFMRAVLKAYDVKDRVIWVADSFEGCPKPNVKKYPHDANVNFYTIKKLAVPLRKVKANFERYGLLDSQVRFLKGWFKDTLSQAPIEKLAILRVDADLYESTMNVLINLYPKLSRGGYLIIDDFQEVTACRKAVLDYRKSHSIKDAIVEIDRDGVYWQRS